MESGGTFHGAALDGPDEKGRVALPSRLRNSVPGDSKSRQIYITEHPDAPCLIGSGAGFMTGLDQFLKTLQEEAKAEERPFNSMAVRRKLFGGTPVPMDSSGRFTMPDNLAPLANIEGELFFLGMGPFFEIWDYNHLMTLEGDEYEVAKRKARTEKQVNEKRALEKKAAKP